MLTEISLPKTELAHAVRCYMTLNLPPDSANSIPKKYRLLSDGCPELIFHFGTPPQKRMGGTTNSTAASALLMGLYLRYVDLQYDGPCQTLFVQFQPWTQAWLLGTAASQATDNQLDLDFVFYAWERAFMDRIRQSPNPTEAIQVIEQWLTLRLATWVSDAQIEQAVALLHGSGGNIAIQTLEEKVNLGMRRLEQKFVDQVGVCMKYYARIVRLRRTAEAIRLADEVRLTEIGYEYGFFDQSHLIREFKHFAAMTPTVYARAIKGKKSIYELDVTHLDT